MKITLLSDVQGNWDDISACNNDSEQEIVIHSGNFGFWDRNTIAECDFNYLKQLILFLTILDKELIEEINDKININQIPNMETIEDIKAKIVDKFSYIEDYIAGTKKFKVPVYTIFGPMDDAKIINKLQTGEINIPNLYLIDHKRNYIVKLEQDQPDIKIYGMSGKFKFLNLFNSGDINYENGLINGKFGELWITLLQISEFYQLNYNNLDTINFFVCYNSIMKNPILEYLAMITNANFTISQGLHFKFPVIGNEMSFLNSIENFKLKFSKFRIKFGEIFKLIKDELAHLDDDTKQNLQIGLEIFDKIPIIHSNQIIPLSLEDTVPTVNSNEINIMLNKINELYFENFYNLWHFNLCDFKIDDVTNIINLSYINGKVLLQHCFSSGFDFNFKHSQIDELFEVEDDEFDEFDEELNNEDFKFNNNTRGRGRGRGRVSRGRGGSTRGSSTRGRARGGRRSRGSRYK